MDRVFVASFLLVVQSCLMGAQQCPEEELNVALEPLYSQLGAFKDQLDAVKLLGSICGSVFACTQEDPLGMEDGRIQDDHITASSSYSENHAPERARLNIQGYSEAWVGADGDSSPWIQVYFDSKVHITGVITQGRGDYDQWVTEYEVMYSDDGEPENWQKVKDADGTPKKFVGNTDRNTEVTTRFPATLHTRFLRILLTDWHVHRSMRFEVIGC